MSNDKPHRANTTNITATMFWREVAEFIFGVDEQYHLNYSFLWNSANVERKLLHRFFNSTIRWVIYKYFL
jgi:hypothetical protein